MKFEPSQLQYVLDTHQNGIIYLFCCHWKALKYFNVVHVVMFLHDVKMSSLLQSTSLNLAIFCIIYPNIVSFSDLRIGDYSININRL